MGLESAALITGLVAATVGGARGTLQDSFNQPWANS